MLTLAIIGPTLSGNMGGAAMIATTCQEARARVGDGPILLFSYRPEDDRRLVGDYPGLEIVPMPFFWLAVLYLPLSILAWPLHRLGFVQKLLAAIPFFASLARTDILIDQCGIAFSDKRGFPLLIYNLACSLPALVMGVKVAKVSQSLGPFKEPFNRVLARAVLKRVARVIARGEHSREHMISLGFPETLALPDTSFALRVPDTSRKRAREILAGLGVSSRPIILSPSEVVRRLARRAGVDFDAEFAAFLQSLANRPDRRPVVLLPHSVARDGSKNNDIDLCHELMRHLPPDSGVVMIEDIEDPVVMRAILGEAELHIGCRFHSIVGALAMGVPALTVGWSHKYDEMASPLQQRSWGMDYRDFSARHALSVLAEFEASLANTRDILARNLPETIVQARRNYDLAFALLEGHGGSA